MGNMQQAKKVKWYFLLAISVGAISIIALAMLITNHRERRLEDELTRLDRLLVSLTSLQLGEEVNPQLQEEIEALNGSSFRYVREHTRSIHAQWLVSQGEYEAALPIYRELARRRRSVFSPVARLNVVYTLLSLDRMDEALSEIALLNSRSHDILNHEMMMEATILHAYLLEQSGQIPEALALYRTLLVGFEEDNVWRMIAQARLIVLDL